MASDLFGGAQVITGTGAATATATLAAGPAGMRGYVQSASATVVAGIATACLLELKDAGTTRYAASFPVTAAVTATGGQISFPVFIPITGPAAALTVVATTTGASTTNVYAVVAYGP